MASLQEDRPACSLPWPWLSFCHAPGHRSAQRGRGPYSMHCACHARRCTYRAQHARPRRVLQGTCRARPTGGIRLGRRAPPILVEVMRAEWGNARNVRGCVIDEPVPPLVATMYRRDAHWVVNRLLKIVRRR